MGFCLRIKIFVLANIITTLGITELYCQQKLNNAINVELAELTLNDVIRIAHINSNASVAARYGFAKAEVQYNVYKKQYLPIIIGNFTVPSLDHSLNIVQNTETGIYKFVQSNLMRINGGISISQSIPFTGGLITLNSYLERIDQFNPQREIAIYNQPVYLTLTQPIIGTFNYLKWNKKLEPIKYEKAKTDFLDNMEDISEKAVEYFFKALIAKMQLDNNELNLKNYEQQYEIWKTKFELGYIKESDLMQLELSLKNIELEKYKSEKELIKAMDMLNLFLHLDKNTIVKLIPPQLLPEIKFDLTQIINLANSNTSFKKNLEFKNTEAKKELERIKRENMIKVNLYARIGLQKNASDIVTSFQHPSNQQNVNIGITVPILDWGIRKEKVKLSELSSELTKKQAEEDYEELNQKIVQSLMEFNNQSQQYRIAIEAEIIAQRNYQIAIEQATIGKISVFELISSQYSKDKAIIARINELYNYWAIYYRIRRITLFDFIQNINLVEDFDKRVIK